MSDMRVTNEIAIRIQPLKQFLNKITLKGLTQGLVPNSSFTIRISQTAKYEADDTRNK